MVMSRDEKDPCALRSRLLTCQMTDVSGNMEAESDANRSTFMESAITLVVRVLARICLTLSAGTRTKRRSCPSTARKLSTTESTCGAMKLERELRLGNETKSRRGGPMFALRSSNA